MFDSKKVGSYWLKEIKITIGIIIFGLIFNILIVEIPIQLGVMIDALINQEPFEIMIKAVIFYILIVVIVQFSRFLKRYFVRLFANRTNKTMQMITYNNVINKPILEFEKENTGDLMTRILGDVEITVEGMRKLTTEVFDTGVIMLSYIFALFSYDVTITLLSCIAVPFAMLLAELLKTVIYKYSRAYRKKVSVITDKTYEMIEHAILLRTHGVLDKNIDEYNVELDDLEKKAVKANMLEQGMVPIYVVIASLGIICVIYFGGMKVIDSIWSIGDFTAYLGLFTAFTIKASKSAKLFNSVQKAKISWQRILPYLEPIKHKDETNNIVFSGNISVNNLSFIYPGSKREVISNISFSANKGEIIGISGPIACGKSTFGLSLVGLYDYIGSIKINDKELREYSEYERSQMISYLGHNPSLLSDTIYNNITLGRSQDISQVLKDVCFETDLLNMPLKEQTLIGSNGMKMSGGQQARIALARALLMKNEIIILDDPFSAVDMKTETEIIRNIRKNYKDSIIFIISHRLNIFPLADKIIMFDHGIIYGSHQDMLTKSELYRQIYQLQGGDK